MWQLIISNSNDTLEVPSLCPWMYVPMICNVYCAHAYLSLCDLTVFCFPKAEGQAIDISNKLPVQFNNI